VRTRATTKPWFGPKRYLGWGWAIQSWEGLLTTAVFAVLMVIGSVFLGRSRWVGLPLLLLAYGVVVLLTGDPPGGPAGPGESGSHDTTS
jgi:hypothetical protein